MAVNSLVGNTITETLCVTQLDQTPYQRRVFDRQVGLYLRTQNPGPTISLLDTLYGGVIVTNSLSPSLRLAKDLANNTLFLGYKSNSRQQSIMMQGLPPHRSSSALASFSTLIPSGPEPTILRINQEQIGSSGYDGVNKKVTSSFSLVTFNKVYSDEQLDRLIVYFKIKYNL